jgi:hypothetical protein
MGADMNDTDGTVPTQSNATIGREQRMDRVLEVIIAFILMGRGLYNLLTYPII